MDEVDRATEVQERWLEARIRAARGIPAAAGHRREPQLPGIVSGEPTADCCDGCGLLIPSERQVAMPGTRYCVECAAELERRTALDRWR